jgi:hypothetical protein
MTVRRSRRRGARRHRAGHRATSRCLHTGRLTRLVCHILEDLINSRIECSALSRPRHGARDRATTRRLPYRRRRNIVGIREGLREERTVHVREASGVGMHGESDCSPCARPTLQFCLAGREFGACRMRSAPFFSRSTGASNSGS